MATDTKTKTTALVDAEQLLRVPSAAPLVPFPVDVQVPDAARQTPAVGQRATRPDCRLHGLGQTKYIDDMYLPGMLFAKIKRAGVASARIISVDTSEAEKMPGVMAVVTGKDIPCNSFGPSLKDQPVLADERVFYAGDGVVIHASDATMSVRRQALTEFMAGRGFDIASFVVRRHPGAFTEAETAPSSAARCPPAGRSKRGHAPGDAR